MFELQFADQVVDANTDASAISSADKASVKSLFGDFGISSLGSFAGLYFIVWFSC